MKKPTLTFPSNLALLVIGLLIVFAAVLGWKKMVVSEVLTVVQPEKMAQDLTPTGPVDREKMQIQIGEKALTVELVNSSESRSLGLSGRTEIGADGMLFEFSEPAYHAFWMKDMQFDLDFIWIFQGKVVEITPNVPAPKGVTSSQNLPTYAPAQPIDMMLEVVAGDAEAWGVQVGDALILPE